MPHAVSLIHRQMLLRPRHSCTMRRRRSNKIWLGGAKSQRAAAKVPTVCLGPPGGWLDSPELADGMPDWDALESSLDPPVSPSTLRFSLRGFASRRRLNYEPRKCSHTETVLRRQCPAVRRACLTVPCLTRARPQPPFFKSLLAL